MPRSERGLQSKDDFQRFCAELRVGSPDLDEMVEGLRAVARSPLRPRDKTRFARSIARTLSESFHVAEVRAVASASWPPEIAMVLSRHIPTHDVSDAGAPTVEVPPETRSLDTIREVGPLPLLVESGTATVVLVGDEDEHRASLERLAKEGIHAQRVGSLSELQDVFSRESVAGLVVGASGWKIKGPPQLSPRQRLHQILELSNVCWMKLVRGPAWADVHDEFIDICRSVHDSVPTVDRLRVEDQATIGSLDVGCLVDAIVDVTYAERQVDYEFAPTVYQDRIIRAVTSRYLRDKFPVVHAREPYLRVRTLAERARGGLVALISVDNTDVSFVVKVSSYLDARQEARRFRMVAHGTSFEMWFFCHGTLGALVFAPIIETRLGHARTLEDLLKMHDLSPAASDGASTSHAGSIDAALAALVLK